MHGLWKTLTEHPMFGPAVLVALGAVAAYARQVPGRLWRLALHRVIVEVEVANQDRTFTWVETWLARHESAERLRSLVVAARSGPSIVPDSGRNEPDFQLSPGKGWHWLRYHGVPVVVRRDRDWSFAGGSMTLKDRITLRFFGGSRRLVHQFMSEARDSCASKSDGVRVYTSRGDYWGEAGWLAARPLESLVLDGTTLADLIADLEAFRGSAAWYSERGIPYRRGYLFHGPPGTGKTTTVGVLAAHLGLSVATISLSDAAVTDCNLRMLLQSLPPATILLIEDVDCAFGENRATKNDGITLSGVLNAIDGLGSREGRILIMTTNHPEKLDPALVRPGRIDRMTELANATPDQARRLFLWFFRDAPDVRIHAQAFASRLPEGLSMSAIQEHLLRHRDDPESCAATIPMAPAAERSAA